LKEQDLPRPSFVLDFVGFAFGLFLACEFCGLQPLRFHNVAGRVIGREMRISHGGCNGTMAQQFLHGAQIDTALDPLSRAEMAEIMNGDPLQPGFFPAFREWRSVQKLELIQMIDCE